MSFYEHVFIARQDLTPAQVTELADSFVEIIEKNDGKVTKREDWGLRNLAYRIGKNKKGSYVLFNIDAPAKAIQELDRVSRLNEDVIRYLTVQVDALEEGPSAILAPKAKKEEEELFGLDSESGAF